jgi:hypothetical protein
MCDIHLLFFSWLSWTSILSKGSLGRVEAVTYAEHQRQVLRKIAFKTHGLAPLAAAKGLVGVLEHIAPLCFFQL